MAGVEPEDIEAELAILAEQLTAPGDRECLRCYLLRLFTEFGCDGSFRWTIRWRDARASQPGGLLRQLQLRGGRCDCEVLVSVFPGYPPSSPQPPCAGVRRPGSSRPCDPGRQRHAA